MAAAHGEFTMRGYEHAVGVVSRGIPFSSQHERRARDGVADSVSGSSSAVSDAYRGSCRENAISE